MFGSVFLSTASPSGLYYVVRKCQVLVYGQGNVATSHSLNAVAGDVLSYDAFLRGIMNAPNVFEYVLKMHLDDKLTPQNRRTHTDPLVDRLLYEIHYIRRLLEETIVYGSVHASPAGGLLQENPAILCRVLAAIGVPIGAVDKAALCAEFAALAYGNCYGHITDRARLLAVQEYTGSGRGATHIRVFNEVMETIRTSLCEMYPGSTSPDALGRHLLEWLDVQCGYLPHDHRCDVIDRRIERWPRLFVLGEDAHPSFSTHLFECRLSGRDRIYDYQHSVRPRLRLSGNPVPRGSSNDDDQDRNPPDTATKQPPPGRA
jgi:hypothetical protein